MELLNYLLKASCILVTGYLLYHFTFRRFTFFAANRALLIGLLIISLVLPLLHIRVYQALPVLPAPVQLIKETKLFNETETSTQVLATAGIQWGAYLQLFYILTIVGLMIGIVYRVIKLLHIARLSGKREGKYRVVMGKGQPAASFFNLIFLDTSGISPQELEQVLAHEQAHAGLLHSADKLLLEFVKAIFWFNPVIYLIEKVLTEVHEYQVDQVLTQKFETKPYAQLILKLATKQPQALMVNTFAAFGVKGRLAMLFAPRSHGMKKLLYLSFLPLIALFLYAFTITPVYGRRASAKPFTLVLDAGHGGKQKGAISAGGVFEKDLNLQMVNAIAAEARRAGVKVVLTREHDETVELTDRVKETGDAFISIHFNSISPVRPDAHGSEVLVGQNSPASAKLASFLSQQLGTLSGLNAGRKVMSYSSGRSSYVLRENKLPAVIVEVGYLTDAHDLRYVTDKTHQQLIAAKIIDAVNAYRDK